MRSVRSAPAHRHPHPTPQTMPGRWSGSRPGRVTVRPAAMRPAAGYVRTYVFPTYTPTRPRRSRRPAPPTLVVPAVHNEGSGDSPAARLLLRAQMLQMGTPSRPLRGPGAGWALGVPSCSRNGCFRNTPRRVAPGNRTGAKVGPVPRGISERGPTLRLGPPGSGTGAVQDGGRHADLPRRVTHGEISSALEVRRADAGRWASQTLALPPGAR